jgi:hypothetical protein
MVLAAGHLGMGDLEEACRPAQTALHLGVQLKSARCVEYLRQFRRQLAPFASSVPVRELDAFGGNHALWP